MGDVAGEEDLSEQESSCVTDTLGDGDRAAGGGDGWRGSDADFTNLTGLDA